MLDKKAAAARIHSLILLCESVASTWEPELGRVGVGFIQNAINQLQMAKHHVEIAKE